MNLSSTGLYGLIKGYYQVVFEKFRKIASHRRFLLCICIFLSVFGFLWQDGKSRTVLLLEVERDEVSMITPTTEMPIPKYEHRYNCSIASIKELTRVKTTGRFKIPLIMHQIYKSTVIPVQYISLVQSCRKYNPEFTHVIWTDSVAKTFLNLYYPQYIRLFENYRLGVQQSDFMRVLFLYHFGGVYLDMDVECMKPLIKYLDDFPTSAILDSENQMQRRIMWNMDPTQMNSVMLTRKRHPFFKFLIEKFQTTLNEVQTVYRTGPLSYHHHVREYLKRSNPTPMDSIAIAPNYVFSPLADESAFKTFTEFCKHKRVRNAAFKRGCAQWERQNRTQTNIEELTKHSLMIHRFLHLAYEDHKNFAKYRDDVCRIVDDLTTVVI